jgi:hypothetical protein
MNRPFTDSLANAIQDHYLKRYGPLSWWCACGADCLNTEDSWAEHVAASLRQSGFVTDDHS